MIGQSRGASNPERARVDLAVREFQRAPVQRWRSPKPQGGGAVKVAYPFVLETGADDESRSGFQVTPGAFR